MTALDRIGIFKAKPINWNVRKAENSESVAIQIQYQITAALENGEWQDWTQYASTHVRGDHWIVKKDGKPNVKTIETLAEVLNWDGSLASIHGREPPDTVVQITVESETYEGKTYYKVAWLNHEDYVPGGGGASADEVKQLDARFGSFLRAAAKGAAKSTAKPPTAKPAPKPAPAAPPVNHDEIPF